MSERVVAALKLQDAYREQQQMKEVPVEVHVIGLELPWRYAEARMSLVLASTSNSHHG